MIAGRLRWRKRGARPLGRAGLAAFDFAHGTLLFTEASARKRASLHLVRGETDVAAFDRGGLEVLEASAAEFDHALRQENHTLKRALTDPHILSGIGNAFSDEILHRARLSPLKQTHQLDAEESERLYHATTDVLIEWIDRLRGEVGDGFPEKVTAFRAATAVHGKYRQPCPRCGANPAHCLRKERGQLLCHLPDGRPAACRSRALASAQVELAQDARRARGTQVIVPPLSWRRTLLRSIANGRSAGTDRAHTDSYRSVTTGHRLSQAVVLALTPLHGEDDGFAHRSKNYSMSR